MSERAAEHEALSEIAAAIRERVQQEREATIAVLRAEYACVQDYRGPTWREVLRGDGAGLIYRRGAVDALARVARRMGVDDLAARAAAVPTPEPEPEEEGTA